MSTNQQWDVYEPEALDLPYNLSEKGLSELPRLVNGSQNVFVTLGGSIVRRFGTIAPYINNNVSTVGRVERAIIYETMETSGTPLVYLVMSVFNESSSLYEIWYQELVATGPATAVSAGTYRALNQSFYPHEMVVARGLLYIKGFPVFTSEKLGSVIFNGTGGTVTIQPWGGLGPTVPAQIGGSNTAFGQLIGAINATTTTINVRYDATNNNFSTIPITFIIYVENEQMQVSNVTGSTFTVVRGFAGTTAAAHGNNTTVVAIPTWAVATTETFQLSIGWTYSYAWISNTGQYTNRAPTIVTGAGSGSSTTRPSITPLISTTIVGGGSSVPQMIVQGLADTTNYPQIAIFRTTDGGGTFYLIDVITNIGAGNITYTDKMTTNSLFPSTIVDGPVPDTLITGTFAPTLTSNSPPPTCIAPGIVGTCTPSRSSSMAYFQGRIWYGIGNVLFFSSQEETLVGVPEESFPSGVNGNFFRLQYPIVALQAISEALYIFTYSHVYVITGSTLDTFSYQPLFDNFGMNPQQYQAVTRFGESVAFMTHDYRMAIIENGLINVISDPLVDSLSTFIAAQTFIPAAQFQLRYYSDSDREWLVLCGNRMDNITLSQQWIYDLKRARGGTSEQSPPLGGFYSPKRHFWTAPWTYPSVCILVGRISEATTRNVLLFFTWNNGATSYIVKWSGTATTDTVASGTQTYPVTIIIGQIRVPAGNHVNAKRVPDITPVIYSLRLERTTFMGDTDPDVYYFKDDIYTTPVPPQLAEDPPRRPPSLGYKTLEYPINEVAQRFAFKIQKLNSADNFELQNFQVLYDPEGGS